MAVTSKVGSTFNFSMSWAIRPAHDDELRLVGARQTLVGVLQHDQGALYVVGQLQLLDGGRQHVFHLRQC
jgi:hypothetical protein